MSEERVDTRDWRWAALIASMILNLFLVALISGYFLRGGNTRAGFGSPLPRVLARVEAILPSKDAAAFAAVIQRDAPRFQNASRQLAEARHDLERQIAAEPFDQEGARRAMIAWRRAWNGFFDEFGNTLVDGLAQVSPEGRRKLIAERRSTEGQERAPARIGKESSGP